MKALALFCEAWVGITVIVVAFQVFLICTQPEPRNEWNKPEGPWGREG